MERVESLLYLRLRKMVDADARRKPPLLLRKGEQCYGKRMVVEATKSAVLISYPTVRKRVTLGKSLSFEPLFHAVNCKR